MNFVNKIQNMNSKIIRLLINDLPTWFVNTTYNYYSSLYKGQVSLGIQVSKELILSQEELNVKAAGKLALTLYHMFYHVTGLRIQRIDIKKAILTELHKNNLHLTEDVILLTRSQLESLISNYFDVPKKHMAPLLERAYRRRILREALENHKEPGYFESIIEEKEDNGRGDYETVFYKAYTDEGKEIGFRRLASIEEVTAGDNRPSILLIPGFANNSNCFNLTNKFSIAKDMADMGFWVYLFDPRGMGVNIGKFDPLYTVDTLIDYDLSTVVRTISSRSKGKPTILVGHSMGGLVSETMVLNWNIRKNFDNIDIFDKFQKEELDKFLPAKNVAENNLSMVRGIVSLGSPKFFQKMSHLLFPSILWLNHFSRILRLQKVPFQEFCWCMTQLPLLKEFSNFLFNLDIGDLNFLISPQNHKADKTFTLKYLNRAMESVPLGIGFQFVKAIYNEEGFKRLDNTHFNYTQNLSLFPADIPVFHFWGTNDHLASVDNIRFSKLYPHKIKKIYHIKTPKDMYKIKISSERSQLVDFIIEDANHLDLLYGKIAQEIVYPILMRIIHQVWDEWSYDPLTK